MLKNGERVDFREYIKADEDGLGWTWGYVKSRRGKIEEVFRVECVDL